MQDIPNDVYVKDGQVVERPQMFARDDVRVQPDEAVKFKVPSKVIVSASRPDAKSKDERKPIALQIENEEFEFATKKAGVYKYQIRNAFTAE